jgi:dihydrofolate synthase/folylpolyglutamate synthase
VAQRALDYLFELEQFGIKFGLDNMRALVDALGHPDRGLRIVHVAGTNGKGSVTAMIDTVLRSAGHRTGRYTSPHLVDLSERFVIDGRPVSAARLEDAAEAVRRAVDRLLASGRLRAQPTFFEATTAVALILFREAAVDVAVCEVGLGGRLDATNVLAPAVTAITSIGRDHQHYLGSTLAEIAAEKAGIIKAGVPVVLGDLPPDAAVVIQRMARDVRAPVIHAGEGVELQHLAGAGRPRPSVRVRTPARDYGAFELALAGSHQVGNALVAIRVLETLDGMGIRAPVSSVREGLASTHWPGRLDLRRLADGRELLMDAAHNPEGAQSLASFLASEPGEPRVLIFTAMRDKDVTDMLRVLAPRVRALIMTRADTKRCAEPEALAATARALQTPCSVMVEPSLGAALDAAWRMTPRIAVAGSIFLVGDVMKRQGWS